MDHPNSRSLHTQPIPRSGGLGLFFGVIATWILYSAAIPAAVWLSIALLIGISWIDDIRRTPIWIRLLIQIIAAAIACTSLLYDRYDGMLLIGIAAMVIWMSNLYNFMDGSDGLAGGMTAIGFACYGSLAVMEGDDHFALINFTIAASALAFLLHNFHPARIFLGDVGSVPLGFLAATLGIMGWIGGLWTLWFPCLVFSPFIADATVTLIKRMLRGEKFWLAHREHYYQRLVQNGWGHRNTALSGYTLMLGAGGSAIWASRQDADMQLWIFAIWIVFYTIMMLAIDYKQRLYADHG